MNTIRSTTAIRCEDLQEAAQLVAKRIHRMPIFHSSLIDEMMGCHCYFKGEHLQKTGSFKVRGALYALSQLHAEERQKGVVTHSSGNHGQALAWAGKQMGIAVHVVVPEDAPAVKVEAMRHYGASIHFCAPGQRSREAACDELQQQLSLHLIPPYDDHRIITGQSTMMRECLEELPELDAALIPVGGGGLLSGSLLAAECLRPNMPVFGAEPAQADDALRSLKTGERQPQHAPNTIADGLRTALGERNFEIIRHRVSDILPCSEEAIGEGLNLVFRYLKQAVEPSAAVALASLMEHRQQFAGKRVLLILCGGNAMFGGGL